MYRSYFLGLMLNADNVRMNESHDSFLKDVNPERRRATEVMMGTPQGALGETEEGAEGACR